MNFRKSIKSDVNNIMHIIKQAQDYFKENKIDQWQNNYPNNETIENDINKNESYILEEDGVLFATAAISFNEERTYDVIYDGNWLSNDKYAVVHRIAVSSNYKGRGVSGELFKDLEKICKDNNVSSIKIDTHKDNKSMQRFLEKSGFKYCGVILLSDESERIAFEKLF